MVRETASRHLKTETFQNKKKRKVTDVLSGKKSKSEDFTLAYLLNVTHLFGEMSNPYFHLFAGAPVFNMEAYWSKGPSRRSPQSLCAPTRSSNTAKLQ